MTIKELKDFIEMVTACGVREDAEVRIKEVDGKPHYTVLREENLGFSMD